MPKQNETPKTIRLHNPGAIKDFGDAWIGKIGSESSKYGAFVKFKHPVWGYRALLKSLYNKNKAIPKRQSGYPLNTLQELIGHREYGWAPEEADNNYTEAYIEYIEQQTGINRYKPLNFDDDETLKAVAGAMATFEAGEKYPDGDVWLKEAMKIFRQEQEEK